MGGLVSNGAFQGEACPIYFADLCSVFAVFGVGCENHPVKPGRTSDEMPVIPVLSLLLWHRGAVFLYFCLLCGRVLRAYVNPARPKGRRRERARPFCSALFRKPYGHERQHGNPKHAFDAAGRVLSICSRAAPAQAPLSLYGHLADTTA